MKIDYESPVFCDKCPSLALGRLDRAPLCEKCLLEAVGQMDHLGIIEKVMPLVP
jgi:hypothetical protein